MLNHQKIIVAFAVALFFSLNAAYSETENAVIRMMAANISSGNKQNYDNGEGLRIFKALKPDVVMIQEFNYKKNSEADLKEFLEAGFGKDFFYYRESEKTDQIPNGVISKYPILESGEWEDALLPNRDFAWTRIDIPGDKDLWAISVHLYAQKEDIRIQEAEKIVSLVQEKIPDSDYVVIGGDFNTGPRNAPTLQTLSKVFFERSAPVDSEGRTETNMNRNKNYDWLLADRDLEPLMVPVIVGDHLFSNGLVFNSEKFANLEKLGEVKTKDSVAQGMQHFPVIKDFSVSFEKLPLQPTTSVSTTQPTTQP